MAKIPENIVDQIRDASNIVDVVSDYLSLRQRGRNYFGLCPFHKEKTPSFSVNPDLQIFHCFGCGAGGNVFTFVMKIEGAEFPEAVKQLAHKAGITIPEDTEEDRQAYHEKESLYFVSKMAAEFFAAHLKSDAAKSAREYLANRGIPESEYDVFGLGYAPQAWDALIHHAKKLKVDEKLLHKAGLVVPRKDSNGFYDRFRGRILFFIRNLTGQVVGFGGRRMIEDNSPKYINSPESAIYQKRHILYGLHTSREAIRKNDEVVIVEGYTDFTSMWRTGVQNIVATSGTALTEDHARLLRRYTSNAVLLYDADAAGANAALRGADILLENGMDVRICTMPPGLDPDDFARQNSKTDVRRLIDNAAPLMEFKIRRVEQNEVDDVNQRSQATRDIIQTLAKVDDPIRQAFLVRDMAHRLKIDENVLWTEIDVVNRKNRFRRHSETEIQGDAPSAYFQTARGIAELSLLELVTVHPENVEFILQNIRVDEIGHSEIRKNFEMFQQHGLDALAFSPQQILTRIQDNTIASRLSRLMNEEKPYPKPREYARDCIIKFQTTLADEHIKDIRKAIKNSSGDNQRTAEFLSELNTLLNERKKITRGELIIESTTNNPD